MKNIFSRSEIKHVYKYLLLHSITKAWYLVIIYNDYSWTASLVSNVTFVGNKQFDNWQYKLVQSPQFYGEQKVKIKKIENNMQFESNILDNFMAKADAAATVI